MTETFDLARLALSPADGSQGLYWRGPATPTPAGLRLPAGAVADLGTWFNAAPVAWWRALLPGLGLDLMVRGTGEVIVSTVDDAGRQQSRRMNLAQAARFPVPDNAEWCWVSWRAGPEPARLDSSTWVARGLPTHPALRVTAVIPSFRREREALNQLRRLLDPALTDVVARVVLVDQAGTLRAAPGMAETAARAGPRLVLCEQGNLGGSGGFARGMLEASAFPGEAVLLLDDDARIDPEILRRMVVLSALCSAAGRPTILGTPLFSAEQPTVLTATTEVVVRSGFRWGRSDGLRGPVDLAASGPQDWGFVRPEAPTDYVGWWGALLPTGAIADLGLPAPYFLKWDDAEYGLRAGRAGYRIRVAPGTGVWHPTWATKGTLSSWAAMPLHRNRLATAAAYGANRSVLVDSVAHQVKHILSLQYDVADLWDAGLAEVLTGPGWLDGGWASTRERAERVLAASPAGTGPRPADPSTAGRPTTRVVAGRPASVARSIVGVFRTTRIRDVAAIPAPEFHWSDAVGRDAVILEGAGRTLVRDPGRARRALARTLRLHAAAARRWPTLVARYRVALPASTTASRWRVVLNRPPADAREGFDGAR